MRTIRSKSHLCFDEVIMLLEESLLVYPKNARQVLGVGSTQFYELAKLPSFPKPKTPLGKRPMYLRTDLENWANNLK